MELVTIAKDELERLRKLEADLPALLEKARYEGGMDRLKALHQKQKENPKQHSENMLKRYHLKKEEINARRREAYRLKKEAKLAGAGAVEGRLSE